MKSNPLARRLIVALGLLLPVFGAHSAAIDRLPDSLDAAGIATAERGTRGWTARDIVEIRWITDIAISSDARAVAFLLKQSFVEPNEIRYGLYLIERSGKRIARKLAESPYIADLSLHPDTALWTVRADFGSGAQLYEVDAVGKTHLLVQNTETAPVGGNLGLIRSSHEGPQATGVVAYQWAPDGSVLWYTKLRLLTAVELQRRYDTGLVYDADTMFSFETYRKSDPMMGTELRSYRPASSEDKLLAYEPVNQVVEMAPFSPRSTTWSPDSRSIQYLATTMAANGEREFNRWNVDVASGEATRLPQGNASALETVYGAPSPDGRGLISVKAQGDDRHLVHIGPDGSVLHDYGTVEFTRLAYDTGPWWDQAGEQGYLFVHYRDHDGLLTFPPSRTPNGLQKITDQLSECAFAKDLSVAVCVRENLTLAPELIEISPQTGRITVLSRPNAGYDAIQPLKSERQKWTNQYGDVSDGYVTYPRGYVTGRRYPTLLVTHGGDAQNKFAYFGFQWDHPVQLFAEAGYVVLSVNDPAVTSKTRAASDAFMSGTTDVDVAQMQFYKNISPVAGMEAAMQWAVDSGIADPQHAGIAGYSRGCEVVEYALAHSKMFKVGADGDAGGWNPGGYWVTGTTTYRALYRGMYGGSPYDVKALPNYEKYAAAFHTKDFAGPLLQQFAMVSGSLGFELNSLLREAKVPAELVLYPDETHIFWQPRHRAAAMAMDLDWFNYWLTDRRDTSSASQERYARWDRMAKDWHSAR
jgi:dipeptidyl aminopeptidase/acylaminoacyl peptidase